MNCEGGVALQVKQMKLERMETFCYLIGDEATKTCALIDPAFGTDRILEEVRQEGFKVTHVINTHSHFDHTSGNAAVVAATDAKICIHKRDAPQLTAMLSRAITAVMGGKRSPKADLLLEDGDAVEIGETSLKVIHTPGHTPGGICLYAPGHIFTGDTLFVGFVGRTDLPGGSSKTLRKSIEDRIYTLPGDTVVWPGHDYGVAPRSTVENEIETNREVRTL